MPDKSLAEIQEDIVELQILTMHQNDTISALDEVIQSQQKQIEKGSAALCTMTMRSTASLQMPTFLKDSPGGMAAASWGINSKPTSAIPVLSLTMLAAR